MSTKDYFTKQAAGYDKQVGNGIIGKIRNDEVKTVLKHLKPQEGEAILDIPCGSGYYADFVNKSGATIYGIDLAPGMMDVFKKKGYKGEVGDLESFSLGKKFEKFDKVLSVGGFEFCKNHKTIIQNLITHTKENGKIVIFFSGNNIFGLMYKVYHNVLHNINPKVFSKKEIQGICKNEEIEIIEIEKCGLYGYVVTLKKHTQGNSMNKSMNKETERIMGRR